MKTWAILATGPSMNQLTADYVRARRCAVAAVSDAWQLAPWADVLVSNDAAWWNAHPEALSFVGRKFCSASVPGTELIPHDEKFNSGSNSGLQAMRVADMLGADLIVLLGFDMHGSHFFGEHKPPLKNTQPARMEIHKKQFERWDGCAVINCTPDSALSCFPKMALHEVLP